MPPKRAASTSAGRRAAGSVESDTRALLLDAAEKILREEGAGALTARRIGAKAGVHYQLIHYYFGAMDNLLLELWRRYSQQHVARLAAAFISPRPLRTIWDFNVDRQDAALQAELLALARRRTPLREEIARTVEKLRQMQASALERVMDDHGLRARFGSAETLMVFVTGLARILVVEDELGISAGDAQARALIEGWIEGVEKGARLAEQP